MQYQPVDRSFNMAFGYRKENLHLWPLFQGNGITTNEEAYRFFHFDEIHIVAPVDWLYPPFPKRVVSETATTRILMTADGLLAEGAES